MLPTDGYLSSSPGRWFFLSAAVGARFALVDDSLVKHTLLPDLWVNDPSECSMAREVRHDANGPYIVDEDEFEELGCTVAICQCGLSTNKPFCDGSHTTVADEEEDVVYRYENDDNEGERRVIDQ